MIRRVIEVGVAIGVGVVVFLLVRPLISPSDDGPQQDSSENTTTTAALTGPVNPIEFLETYERSLSGPYLLRGTRTRFEAGDEIDSHTVKLARSEGNATLREGDSVVFIEEGTQQVCEILNETLVNCSSPQAAPTNHELALEMGLPFSIDPDDDRSPKYKLYDSGPGCWQAIATRPLPLEPWGQTTTWCFDDGTGALIHRQTVSGTTSFVVDITLVRAEVTPADFGIS